MDKQNEITGQFVRLIETIANKKMKKLDFGNGVILYRGEIHLIKALGDNPGMFISEIARYFGVSRAVISKNIAKLESQGHVIKKTDEQKLNRVKVYLTPLGEKAYLQHKLFHAKEDKSMFDFLNSLNQDELANISIFLKQAQKMINNHF
ncbi:MAG: MarR family transcriptional regulator [Negativicutes bacterium]|nr:MarR family transcriptional regulator [Negativicutes bacterium]